MKESDIWDIDVACQRIPGGRDSIKEMAQLFLSESKQLMRQLRESVTAEDASGVERAAHTLKSSANLFAAERAASRARDIEEMGRYGQLGEVNAAFSKLESEVARFNVCLQRLLDQA